MRRLYRVTIIPASEQSEQNVKNRTAQSFSALNVADAYRMAIDSLIVNNLAHEWQIISVVLFNSIPHSQR